MVIQQPLPGFEQSERALMDIAMSAPLGDKVDRSLRLLKFWEEEALNYSDDGYWLAFSGGKDSIVIKDLAIRAGVKFRSVYNQTTIDPPELIRFIKKEHPDVEWNRPEIPFFVRVATSVKGPPTRHGRWCCEYYKERGGLGYIKIIGVRAAESPRRAVMWKEFTGHRKEETRSAYICPILYWTDEDIWSYIRQRELPYCSLYDEGFKRLGCIGCPLAGSEGIKREFAKWPIFEKQWKRAVIKSWENLHDSPREDGSPRFQARFKSGEEYWEWWISGISKDDQDAIECQMNLMWT